MPEDHKQSATFSCSQPIAKIVGMVGFLMFGWFTFLCIIDRKPNPFWVPIGFIIFAALSAYLFLYSGTITTDGRGITQSSRIGTFFIAWSDIESIATGSGQLVIYGRDQRLALPGPETWIGRDKTSVLLSILRFCESKGIQPRERLGAIFAVSRNTRLQST
jgi:hypothetical protein